ncbi:hypothetical protein [Sphingomonas vulcanisoli]|uniref:hypothetical protein n=1 Tax=Sphingomonas vulcanisoli TaxID=1658060 RepID=UPI0014231314|nr:hypothetical protein [Sphingomonas vulcanisoli]
MASPGWPLCFAVPEFDDQVERWVSRWNPVVPGQAAKAAKPLLTDAVVEKALTTLTSLINLGNGVLVARDKEKADEILRILRAKGHSFDPIAIKSWAIQQGWKNGAADELAKLAVRVGGLKGKPSISGYHDPDGRYARWAS